MESAMKSIMHLVLAVSVLLLILMFLFPPFMVVDPESGGRVHAALGRYAVWDPPSADYAFRVLYPGAPEFPNPQRLGGFIPRINRVRLISDALAAIAAGSLAIGALRWGSRRIHR